MIKKEKKESKFRKLGRLNGEFTFAFILLAVKQNHRKEYLSDFLSELETYSFRPHYVNEERHEGCKSWITELPDRNTNYNSPNTLALKIKADLDGLQQKNHARNYYLGFLEVFSDF